MLSRDAGWCPEDHWRLKKVNRTCDVLERSGTYLAKFRLEGFPKRWFLSKIDSVQGADKHLQSDHHG
ncbi:hypothetical protein CEXT_484811 [Caerostris extrusa]|uniref:Uncharacterized protein n=1 Tax=Caerostris extrusa TaxID=172846 RepID=A0AAV4VHW5_CAEEX|nr:hypothetical protein CEXT_484811 [Caerostris extrusa]